MMNPNSCVTADPIDPARLAVLLKRLGLRQTDLSARLGCKQSLFSRRCSGVRPAPPGWRETVAAALGVDPLELAPREPRAPRASVYDLDDPCRDVLPRLLAEMKKRGVSPQSLSKKTNIGIATVERFLDGRWPPVQEWLKHCEAALGLELYALRPVRPAASRIGSASWRRAEGA